MAIRILIADDHAVIRTGLRTILSNERDLHVVGEAADSDEAMRLAAEVRPDVVLTDISMPGPAGGGITLARILKAAWPTIRVLILTVHEDEDLLIEAFHAGADGYVVKRAAESELVNAIQAVQRGEKYIHPAMTEALLRSLDLQRPTSQVSLELLTPRETEVLRLIAKGYTNRQIASRLNLSVRTVEGHRDNLKHKLGLEGRAELTDYAEKHGLLK